MTKRAVAIKFSEPWDPNTSVLQKEFELSAQRSHSARIAHTTRKKQQQKREAAIKTALENTELLYPDSLASFYLR